MDNPNEEAHKGDILLLHDETPNPKKPSHYIVYLEIYLRDPELFIGAMLTHSDINGNIPLQNDHFVKADPNGNAYAVRFDKSLVLNHPLFKKGDCVPFTIVGRLSQKGIAFIEAQIAPYVVQFRGKDVD